MASARAFIHAEVALSRESDLAELASKRDPEALEDMLDAIQRARNLEWPLVEDRNGRLRRAQLFVPEKLTVAELCEVVDNGKWPESWTRPGSVLFTWWFGQ